ncbi:uncharacterized protein LOC144163922 [Haemaphysalis longicornis]
MRCQVIDKLVATREELRKIDAQVEDTIPVEELEKEHESAAHYGDCTLETLTRLQGRLEDLEGSTVQGAPAVATDRPLALTTAPPPVFGLRLPTLAIKPYNVDVGKWMAFLEQFNGAVHTQQALTSTDKFHYLCNYLEGEAAAAIAGLPSTEACYESAIQHLKERFGDTSRIIQRHLRMLHGPSASETRALRNLYDSVQLNIRCLNVLGV